MIAGANLAERADTLLRLASLPKTNIAAILIARGLDPSNVDATLEAVVAVGVPVDAEEAINYSFRPRVEPPQYPVRRFGDGTYAVFYSSLEESRLACSERMRHHQRAELTALQSAQMPFPRYFTLVRCDFRGRALMLRGHEEAHPDLISLTATATRSVRRQLGGLKKLGAQALHTTSARRPEGACVPVYCLRQCLRAILRAIIGTVSFFQGRAGRTRATTVARKAVARSRLAVGFAMDGCRRGLGCFSDNRRVEEGGQMFLMLGDEADAEQGT